MWGATQTANCVVPSLPFDAFLPGRQAPSLQRVELDVYDMYDADPARLTAAISELDELLPAVREELWRHGRGVVLLGVGEQAPGGATAAGGGDGGGAGAAPSAVGETLQWCCSGVEEEDEEEEDDEEEEEEEDGEGLEGLRMGLGKRREEGEGKDWEEGSLDGEGSSVGRLVEAVWEEGSEAGSEAGSGGLWDGEGEDRVGAGEGEDRVGGGEGSG